jgi:pantothenate kinase
LELIELQDGFHFSKRNLAVFSCPETAFRRRGAPFTFDADAFVNHVTLLKNCSVTQVDRPELGVRLPSFDHTVQDPVEDDIYVPSSAKVVIVEGNYLLLDEEPWNKATGVFDERYGIHTPWLSLTDQLQVVCRCASRNREGTSH